MRTRAQEEATRLAVGTYGQDGPSVSATCAGNSSVPRRYVVDAALANLQRWARTGRQPRRPAAVVQPDG